MIEKGKKKTLNDCIVCNFINICDAHVPNGEWKHRKGPKPCVVVK